MRYQSVLLFLAFFTYYCSQAQEKHFKIPDSLKNKSYKYLDDRVYEFRNDTSTASIYLLTYLNKARLHSDWKEAVNGYQNLIHLSPSLKKLIYADSMIYAAKKTDENVLIGSSYLSKGIVYYGQKKQTEALDYYLKANGYISKTDDPYLKYKVKYHIALVKYYLGFYEEAISLFRECIIYFKDDNHRAYLNSLHCLGLSYNRSGNYGLCSQTNALGLNECERLNIPEMKSYFNHSEGFNSYFQHNYGKAINNIKSSLKDIEHNNDFGNVSVGNFYIGKSYLALHKIETALPHFLKVDEIFNAKNYMRPDLREVYEILIKHYKTRKDLKKQLYFVDQLLKADKLLYETHQYLIGKVHKEYDTVMLVSEKEKISRELLKEKQYDIIFACVILLMSFILITLSYRYYRNRVIYKKNFELLMDKMNDESKNKPKLGIEKPLLADISPETVLLILKQLDKFEQDRKFLEKDWTLGSLAVYFNSNTKYLSNIISYYREKKFTDYINDLRIDYVISLLHNGTKFQNYTYSALAEEAGFSSTQRFAFAFKSKTGISVNYFIEQISNN